MHGGAQGSGAPIGNSNAAKHGYYTAQSIADRRLMRALLRGYAADDDIGTIGP